MVDDISHEGLRVLLGEKGVSPGDPTVVFCTDEFGPPRPLRHFHRRFGIWENEPIEVLDRRDGLAADRDG